MAETNPVTHNLGNANANGADDNSVPVNLYNPEGILKRTFRTDPQFATRFIEFDGKKYEKTDGDNAWIEIGEAPHTALSGAPDKD